jgi:hypothetical protein
MGLKLGLIGMAALGVLCGWLYIQGQWKDMQILELENEVQKISIERDVAEGNVEAAKEQNEIQANQISEYLAKIVVIEKQRDENRIRVEYVEGLFKDDRFQRLLGTNPTLIELRMKKATAKVLKELDDVTN